MKRRRCRREAKRTVILPCAEGTLHRAKPCFIFRAPQVRFIEKSTCASKCFFLAGIAGLEPAKCKSQSLVPYRLGYIPICLCLDILSHIKSIVNIKIPPKRDFCLYITFCAHSAFQARRNRFCQAL